jgi:hypothetical protein
MRNIEIALSDGFIGNKGILLALSNLATGNLNAKLAKGARAFTMKDILPATHDYIVPPLSEQEQRELANEQLLGFMVSAPGAEKFLEKYRG